MTTNILNLPFFSGSGTTFAIALNSDWFDSIFFISPGSPSGPVKMVGQLTLGSDAVTVPSTVGLVPGMPISPGPGIDYSQGVVVVGEITTTTQFKMVQQSNNYPVRATINDAVAQLVFQPLPLDLSGIEFSAELRTAQDSEQVLLSMGTVDGRLLNGGKDGTLGFNVQRADLEHLLPRNYVMDIVAAADGHMINLFPAGPGTVMVTGGVTLT